MNALVKFDDATTHDLGTMDYVTDQLGTAFRDKMIATLGGTQIKVPLHKATLGNKHPLVQALGRIDAEELVEVVPGEGFYVPNGKASLSTRDQVVSLVLASKTTNEIAQTLGISDRQVRRHRSDAGLNSNDLAKRLGVSVSRLPRRIKAAIRKWGEEQARTAILTGG